MNGNQIVEQRAGADAVLREVISALAIVLKRAPKVKNGEHAKFTLSSGTIRRLQTAHDRAQGLLR